VNPDKGFIVSANNFVTSQNMPHGISYAFSFTHRAARITEMIRLSIEQGIKVDANFMKEIQKDVVDIQAREALPAMLQCVRYGHKGRDLGRAVNLLEQWDHRFSLDSSGATLF